MAGIEHTQLSSSRRERLDPARGCRFVMRRLFVLTVLLAAFTAFSRPLCAQLPNEEPHLLRVLVRLEAIPEFRAAFANLRATQPDIQRVALDDSSTIARLLGLPTALHISR